MVEVIVLTESLKIDGEIGSWGDLSPGSQMTTINNAKVYERKDNRPLYVAEELYLNPSAVVVAFAKEKIEKEGEY